MDVNQAKSIFPAVRRYQPGQEVVLDANAGSDELVYAPWPTCSKCPPSSAELPKPALELARDVCGPPMGHALWVAAGNRPPEPGVPGSEDLTFLEPPTSRSLCISRLGHYEVLEIIGKGGFGVVLKSFDQRLHRVVAVKVLSPPYAANGSASKRFIREAITYIKNEHVVSALLVRETADHHFL